MNKYIREFRRVLREDIGNPSTTMLKSISNVDDAELADNDEFMQYFEQLEDISKKYMGLIHKFYTINDLNDNKEFNTFIKKVRSNLDQLNDIIVDANTKYSRRWEDVIYDNDVKADNIANSDHPAYKRGEKYPALGFDPALVDY